MWLSQFGVSTAIGIQPCLCTAGDVVRWRWSSSLFHCLFYLHQSDCYEVEEPCLYAYVGSVFLMNVYLCSLFVAIAIEAFQKYANNRDTEKSETDVCVYVWHLLDSWPRHSNTVSDNCSIVASYLERQIEAVVLYLCWVGQGLDHCKESFQFVRGLVLLISLRR